VAPGSLPHWVRRRIRARANVYLRPTQHGLWWIGTLVVLLLIGWAYGNNLCLGIAMLLFAVTIVFLMEAHFNLDGLIPEGLEVQDQFTGRPAFYRLRWRSRRDKIRRDIRWAWDGGLAVGAAPVNEWHGRLGEVEGTVVFPHRGHHRADHLVLRSRYPLGLFQAWCYHRLPLEAWAYPAPMAGVFPGAGEAVEGENPQVGPARDGDEPGEFRLYGAGDPPSRIAWKVMARGLPPHTKTFETARTEKKRFHWPWGGGGERERSVLGRAVQDAFEAGEIWTFVAPQGTLGWGGDALHRQRSLRLLTEAP
jgi:uncharacterized protein (DUF58 family)